MTGSPRDRDTPIGMAPDEFRKLGHDLVDRIARHLETIREGRVTPGETPAEVRRLLGNSGLPREGAAPGPLLEEAAEALFAHSLFNGHPRFWGYITSGPAPIGVLADFLAAAVNANVGAWKLAPLATEIEAQTVRWIAEFIGFPADCGGLLTSGGNMANFVCFLTARRARAGGDIRRKGLGTGGMALRVYASSETHTWLQKAADLFGHGTDAVGWIPPDGQGRMDVEALKRQVEADRRGGLRPFLVVGTAGSVGTGAVDPLPEIGKFCREADLWFHVDGAYGGLAARVPDVPADLSGLRVADSVAVDPHKWLYAPLEAGCALVRSPGHLADAFSYHPPYYHFDESAINYFDLGMQNSRGFRALKVWLALRQGGQQGYRQMIGDDIRLARRLCDCLEGDPEFETLSQNLSITTFRYVPADLPGTAGSPGAESYLDRLNREILTRLESGGEAFLSNAVVDGRFALRACIVNFRTSLDDIELLPEIVRKLGRECDTR